MLPFFSAPDLRRETRLCRLLITLAALLFLLTALLSALPDRQTIVQSVEKAAMAGYHSTEITTRHRPPILAEFDDRPWNSGPPLTKPQTSETAERPPLPTV